MCSGTVRSANFKNRKTIMRNDSEGEEVHTTVVEEVLQCSKCLITVSSMVSYQQLLISHIFGLDITVI